MLSMRTTTISSTTSRRDTTTSTLFTQCTWRSRPTARLPSRYGGRSVLLTTCRHTSQSPARPRPARGRRHPQFYGTTLHVTSLTDNVSTYNRRPQHLSGKSNPATLHAVPPPPIFQPPPHPTATFQRPPCQPPPSTHFPHSSFHQLRGNRRDSLPG